MFIFFDDKTDFCTLNFKTFTKKYKEIKCICVLNNLYLPDSSKKPRLFELSDIFNKLINEVCKCHQWILDK